MSSEIRELREQRYKPYLTSMGLFLGLALAVTGYVYNLEQRLINGIFAIERGVSELETISSTNAARLSDIEERYSMFRDFFEKRWDAHKEDHRELYHLTRNKPKEEDDSDAD